jgi:DNA-binding response OmpR family regulator
MKIRILIAEDNENFGLMLLSYLRTNNYDVTWAKNGVQAMEEITNSICRSLVKRLPRWYLEEEVSVLF